MTGGREVDTGGAAAMDRLLLQLSDTPWMVVAGAAGLVAELVFAAVGGVWPSTLVLVGVMVVYGGPLGYVAFAGGRRPWSWAVGLAAAGVAAWCAARWSIPGLPGPGTAPTFWLLRGLLWAALPWAVDRVVDPWLLRGPIRALVAHHPRFRHLRD